MPMQEQPRECMSMYVQKYDPLVYCCGFAVVICGETPRPLFGRV